MSKIKFNNFSAAEKELTQMKYRDLKIACIVRGMLFEDVVEGTYPSLSSWFVKNYTEKSSKKRLEQFDDWVTEKLMERGHAADSPLVQFRLSTVVDEQDNISIRTKSLKHAQVKKEKKPKRERDTTHNIFKGTKKALTFDCASKNMNIADTIARVLLEFPEAQEKSIKIWYKKALKK